MATHEIPVGVFIRIRPLLASESPASSIVFDERRVRGELHDHFDFDFGLCATLIFN